MSFREENNSIPDEIQAYISFMNEVDAQDCPYVSKDRIDKNLEKYGEAMNTLMVYPDIFADIMTPKDSVFSMFFEQRIVVRAMMRYRQGFFTFPRSFSKSFLSHYVEYLMCMFIPRHKGFAISGTKKQAAAIVKQTIIDDLWVRFPLLQNEMQKFRRANKLRTPYKEGADYVEFHFPNGSRYDVIGGSIRGGRRNSAVFEEVIELDATYINESAIPILNTMRADRKGNINPKEPQGKKTFITTAGFQGTFSYDKMLETLCLMLIDPSRYIVLGGTYVVPVMHGLLSEDTIKEIFSSPSFKKDSFEREYESRWSGRMTGAAISPGMITERRKIKMAEYKARADLGPYDGYAISADIAKDGAANTAIIVARYTAGEYRFNYRFVNLFTIDTTDFEVVANVLKQTALKYKAKLLIYDANGVGAALREWLNKETRTSDGIILGGLGIINPPAKSEASVITYRDPSVNICYEVKSGGGDISSRIHYSFFSRMGNGSIAMLINSGQALKSLQNTKRFNEASTRKKDEIVRPYLYTDIMETELKNLDIRDNSDLISKGVVVVQRNKKIQKDFFSSAEYLIFGVTELIEIPHYKDKNQKNFNKNKPLTFVSSPAKGRLEPRRSRR